MEKGEILAYCYDYYNDHVLRDQNDDIAYYKTVLKSEQPRKVLVVGAGTGRVAIPLSQLADVEALDMDEYRLKRLHEAKNIKCHCMDFCEMRPNETYDLIIIPYSTIQCVSDMKKVEEFIINARACLSKDGMLIFDVSSSFNTKKPVNKQFLFEDYATEISSKIICILNSVRHSDRMSFETEFAIDRLGYSVFENETYLYHNEEQFTECAKKHFDKVQIQNGYGNDVMLHKHLYHCRGK